ncbi:MAG TPA: hypothetical protein VGM56_05185 [Byssovorax sp.]|jgi:hypothetical protein
MRRWGVVLVACLACLGASCGGAAPEAAPAPAAPVVHHDTADLAEQIVAGRVSILVYMDRVRASPMGKQLDETFHWKEFWEGTGFELERDVERSFGTTPDLQHPERGVWVSEVNVPMERVKKAAKALFDLGRTKGHFLDGDPNACDVELRDGSTRRVVFVEPKWVVMLPIDRAAEAPRFARSGGFPDPVGAEAVVMYALDPSKTLHRAKNNVDVPAAMKRISADVAFDVEGGLEIAVDGESTSAEQAKLDAADLTHAVDEATSVGVSALRVHFIDPIVFRADGDHVRGRRTMPVSEVKSILAFARMRPQPADATASTSPEKN